MSIFACKVTEADMVRAVAPEQPAAIEVGQWWMRAEDAAALPIKALRAGFVDLGGACYTVVVSEETLRGEWVCIDTPKNVGE